MQLRQQLGRARKLPAGPHHPPLIRERAGRPPTGKAANKMRRQSPKQSPRALRWRLAISEDLAKLMLGKLLCRVNDFRNRSRVYPLPFTLLDQIAEPYAFHDSSHKRELL